MDPAGRVDFRGSAGYPAAMGKGKHTAGRNGSATTFLKGDFTQIADPLGGLNGAKRQQALDAVAAKARHDFDASVVQLKLAVRRFNPIQLLAHFAFYDQIHLNHSDGKHGYEPAGQSVVEWLQAFVLQVPETEVQDVLDVCPVGTQLHDVNKALNTSQECYGLMRLANKEGPGPVGMAAELIRQHTAFVRNEGYGWQLQRLHREIFRPLDAEFRNREGVTLTDVAHVLWAALEKVQKRLNEDWSQRRNILSRNRPKEIIAGFAELIKQSSEQVRSDMVNFAHDVEKVRAAVMNWLDERNFRHFYFQEADLLALFPSGTPVETVRTLMGQMSIKWGELADRDPEKLLLDNPVWTRPFINVGGGNYYCPVIGLVQSFGLEIVERLLRPHQDLWDRYCDTVRSTYLEDRTEAAVRAAYPRARIFRGLKWTGADGKDYENDVLVLIDTHALIFECKSGRVRALAQRGHAAAMKTEIEKIIGDASRQGRRFAEYLLAQKRTIRLPDVSGKIQELDLTHLLRATTVNVTLDYLGHLAVQQRLLHSARMIAADTALTATLPLHELEMVLELLDRPALSTHYFRRRSEIASANDMLAEEGGMLALYLATAFDFGDAEGDTEHQFIVSCFGKKLDPYFMRKDTRTPAAKPALRLRGWWSDLLAKFETNNFPGWIESSHALLSVSYDKQEKFERMCKQLVRNVRTNWRDPMHNNTCVMVVGSPTWRTAVIYLVIKHQDRKELHELVKDRVRGAVETHGVKRAIVIATSAVERTYPYLGVYFHCVEMEANGLGQPFTPGARLS